MGRYLELDPIAKAGGFNGFYGPNWYGYAEGNPFRWDDPAGLDSTDSSNWAGGCRMPSLDGPTNGNWGGSCWSGGQYSCNGKGTGNAPPLDSGDDAYMRHDLCWAFCESQSTGQGVDRCKRFCNGALLQDLGKLDAIDARRWPRPPRPGTRSRQPSVPEGRHVVVPLLHPPGRVQGEVDMRERIAWSVLLVFSVSARLVYSHAWMFEWWRGAQLALAGVCLGAAVWVGAEHRPRWRAVLGSRRRSRRSVSGTLCGRCGRSLRGLCTAIEREAELSRK